MSKETKTAMWWHQEVEMWPKPQIGEYGEPRKSGELGVLEGGPAASQVALRKQACGTAEEARRAKKADWIRNVHKRAVYRPVFQPASAPAHYKHHAR